MRTTLSISVSKSKHITSAQQHHTERWDDSFNHSNRMISPNKSKQNINLTHNTGTYRERFENLIDQKYNGRRKKDGTPSIRKDAVRMFQVSVNLGEYDDKWNRTVLDKDKMVETLKNDIYPMLVEEFGGEDNILGAAIHMDESTPHLHLDVVPLTSDGKLSAKSFIDGPTDLSKKQTEWLEKAQEKRPDLNFERLEDQSLNGIEMEKLKKLTAQAKAEANEYLQKRNTALQEDIDAEWKILDEVDEKLNKKYDFLVSVQEEQEKTVEEFNKYGERLSVRESELNERERTLDETVNKRVAERTHERTRELDERERTIDETVNKRVEERTHGRTRELDERERTLDETVNKRV
ncbi:plasmid recombination protein, partial [Streptococcus agalactiae]